MADAEDAAPDDQTAIRKRHFRVVGLVAIRRPDLTIVVRVIATGHHIPDDLFADVGAVGFGARPSIPLINVPQKAGPHGVT